MSESLLVIGGNAAGMTAASRAKRLDPSSKVTVLEAGPQIAYSICGLPYWLASIVPRFEDLILFTPERLSNERSIEARVECRATELHPTARRVAFETRSGERGELRYDRLLLATGYRPRLPELEGIASGDSQAPGDPEAVGHGGVFTASRIEDGRAIADWLTSRRPRRAVLVGGGYVGLEMAEALGRRGLKTTLIEASPSLFSAIDPDMAELLERELEQNGVRVLKGRRARKVRRRGDGSVEAVVMEKGGLVVPCDLLFLDVGIRPNVELAERAGIRLGVTGAIAVSERLETSAAGVYAAGNCAEQLNPINGRMELSALGTVAAKQGRVAGENMVGRRSIFRGAVGTSIVQVFGVTAARTGLNLAQAKASGFDLAEARIRGNFRAGYFDEGAPGTVKVLGDRRTGRLLGAQIVGTREAALRIDVAATAVTAGMTVAEAAQLDLSYAPPTGALWNPLLVAMNQLTRQLSG